jgi:RHS repeat-associated protein
MSEITGGAVTESHFAAYDGNGNVAALAKASDGVETARYEYGPFGEPIRMTGAKAKTNPFQFSTKFTDDETGMLYYGYRFCNSSTGRWLSRDPIEEAGGLSLYGFVFNDSVDTIDADGRELIGLPNRLTRQCGIPQTDNRRRLLDNGCIGICQAAQGQNANNQQRPENYGDTKCYISEQRARQRKCTDCRRKVVFSKQGSYKDGKAPTLGPDGTVPNDSVSANSDETFNYVTIGQLRQEEWYIWANNGVNPSWPAQVIAVSKTPCDSSHYLDKIWCVTCIK